MKNERDKSEYTLAHLWTLARRDWKHWLDLYAKYKYLVLVCLCLARLVLLVFSPTTLLTFFCLGWALRGYCRQKMEEVREKGLAYYMPLPIKTALLNRSLLDMLCDLWFIPTLGLYVKTVMAPILSSKARGPEDAVKYLDPLEPAQRRVFITKGLAFLFPRRVTKLLLPRDYFQNPLIEHTLRKEGTFLSDLEDSEGESTQLALPEPLPESPRPPAAVTEGHRELSLEGRGGTIRVISVGGGTGVKKSKVILSSHMMKNLKNMPGRIDPSWDNMHEYQRRKQVSIPRSQSTDKLNVLKLLLDLKRLDFLRSVNRRTAFKVSGLSAAGLLLQLLIFKRTRQWTKSILLLALYLGGVGVLVASVAYLLLHHKLAPGESDKRQAEERLALQAREQADELEASGHSLDE